MVHGKNRIPYWIDWRLTGLAEPDYGATISFGLPIEPEDSQYGKYRLESYGTAHLIHEKLSVTWWGIQDIPILVDSQGMDINVQLSLLEE